MKNLFEEMGKPSKESMQWEDVEESALACQEKGCREVVPNGKYSSVIKVLTWKCNKGHVSKLENFILD